MSAAPWPARVLAQGRWDAGVLLRNGEQLLLTLVLPVLVLLALTVGGLVELTVPPGRERVDVVAPGVLALAVMSTAFTGQAIATGFDRRAGVLRLLGTTPLGRGGLLAGRVLAVLVVQALQVLVLGGAALALGWAPDPAGVLPALLVVVAGTAAFTALALLLAGTLRAEAVLAVANLVWVLLLAGGGVVVPPEHLPGPLAAAAPWLPSGALGEGMRTALVDGRPDVAALAVLTGWALVAGAAAARWFRWG
ncbi:ABC transporter permease [Kineosporiaceae bacterium SCSIO 59966]|nr:ABC transporter permease [Kineosporiaceae bacterium SCSIO 59966]